MQMPSRGHRYEARNKHGISIILTKKKGINQRTDNLGGAIAPTSPM